jgi:hypothetical protein
MELIHNMKELMATITHVMDEESQYDDFQLEFNTIENSIETLESESLLPKDHEIFKAYDQMWKALYANKGSLDCSVDELVQFQLCLGKEVACGASKM